MYKERLTLLFMERVETGELNAVLAGGPINGGIILERFASFINWEATPSNPSLTK